MWVSPDNKIKKNILTAGTFGPKPTENCICTIEISNVKWNAGIQSEYFQSLENDSVVVNIGEANTALDREIDKCLLTLNKNEICSVAIFISYKEVSFVLKLIDFEFRGFIHEWDAKDKISIAQKHKENAVELFKKNRYVDASFRFSKALKLLLSIPIPIVETPNEIDGVEISEINQLKSNLYNNLASCYYKVNLYEIVIELCNKVLQIDEENVKALYKRGFAYSGTNNFEKARDDLTKVLELDKDNETAKDKLQFVNMNISKQEANYVGIVKKMFSK